MHNVMFDSNRFLATLDVWRHINGLTVRDMGELSSIATSTMGFILSGDRPPTMAEFIKLCNVIEFDPKDFFRKVTKNY